MNQRTSSALLWEIHILSTCLRHGMGLESLRFVSANRMAGLDNIWSIAEVLNFDSYKDTAVLELLDGDVTERDIAEFQKYQRCKNELVSLLSGR